MKADRSKRDRERYQALKRAGRCRCGAMAAPGMVRCKPCAKRMRDYDRERVARDRAAGLCVTCRAAPAKQGGRCEGCWTRHTKRCTDEKNATRLYREQHGQCIECEAPNSDPNFTRCADCRRANADKAKARYDARVAAGLCRCCGTRKVTAKAREAGATSCGHCLRSRRARERTL